MREIKWDFVSTGGGDDDGPNNSKLEYFAGDYNYYLAREIIQNSIDARKDKGKPVVVNFTLDFFSKDDFPGYNQLIDIIHKAKEFWNENPTAQLLLNGVNNSLNQDKIPFLKISDFNTTGLNGSDDDKKGSWYSLVRSTGNSPKSSGEGGSFGIGKGAPFAASDQRIVFYASYNESSISIFQGKAELVSYKSDDNDTKRGVGSYGFSQKSIRDLETLSRLPKVFWRKVQGTDIIVSGYKNKKGWEIELIKSVLRNFWYAIFKNDLQVKIQDIEINSINLEQMLTSYFSISGSYRDNIKPIGNPLQYYLAVNRGKYFHNNLPILGEVSFYFLEIDNYLNHVAMLRKSHMTIFSRLFRFPGNYAGVFICDNDNGNEALRKMEPPEHDEWITNRYPEMGDKIYDELSDFIRECLEKSKNIKKSEYSEIPDIYKYLPDNDDEDSENNGNGYKKYTGQEGSEETSQIIQRAQVFPAPVIISPQKIAVLNKKISIDEEDEEEIITPPGPEKIRKKKVRKKTPNNIHIRIYNSAFHGQTYEYTVVIKSNKNGKYDLRFFSIGEDLMDKLILNKVSSINQQEHYFSGNFLRGISLEKNKEVRFIIEVKSAFKNAIKIELSEIQ